MTDDEWIAELAELEVGWRRWQTRWQWHFLIAWSLGWFTALVLRHAIRTDAGSIIILIDTGSLALQVYCATTAAWRWRESRSQAIRLRSLIARVRAERLATPPSDPS